MIAPSVYVYARVRFLTSYWPQEIMSRSFENLNGNQDKPEPHPRAAALLLSRCARPGMARWRRILKTLILQTAQEHCRYGSVRQETNKTDCGISKVRVFDQEWQRQHRR